MSNNNYNPFMDRQLRDEQPINEDQTTVMVDQIETSPVKKINPWLERLKGVGIIVLFFITQTIASIIFILLLKDNPELSTITGMETAGPALKNMFTGMVIAELGLIIILVAVYNKKLWSKFKSALNPFLGFVIKMIGYYALLWTATIFFSFLDAAIFPKYITEAGSNQDLIEASLMTPSLTMIISICITAPIVEEFVFRYGVIKKLLYGVPKYLAAFIAALIFAFAHIGFSQLTDVNLFAHLMLGYIGQALVFGIVYVREDNIFYPIALHIINNVQAVVLIIALANLA